ncbi:lipopolysaccharide biosynthesis protein, partial [Shigella sonnei]|nr:transporter [Shigella sonnei]
AVFFYFIPRYGWSGAVFGSAIATLVIGIFYIISVKKDCGKILHDKYSLMMIFVPIFFYFIINGQQRLLY